VFFGAVGMIAGGGLLTAGLALASGTVEEGHLTLSPASGATSSTPTWSTTDACPAGWQGSAQLADFDTHGIFVSNISPVVASPTAAFNGTLTGTMASLLAATHVANGGTVAFAVGCYTQTGAAGDVEWVQLAFVQLSSNGANFSTVHTGPTPTVSPSATTTSTATPTPTPTPTSTATATPTPTPTSTHPAGGAGTGAGGAALPGGGNNNLLIALGATLLAGSAATMGLAIRRRRLPQGEGPGNTSSADN